MSISFGLMLKDSEFSNSEDIKQKLIEIFNEFLISANDITCYTQPKADDKRQEEEVKAKKEKREPVIVPAFSCHIFRHTFASRFCENETNVKIIQEIMGHADVSTTMNIYADVNQDVTRASIEKLAKNMNVF